MNAATLPAIAEMDMLGLSSRKTLAGPLPITSIQNVSGDTWRIILSGAQLPSTVIPGTALIALYGNQDGYRQVTAVSWSSGLNQVDVIDPTMTASNAIGEASIYRFPQLSMLDNIISNQAVTWAESRTRQSFFGGVQTVREIYSGSGTSELMLDRRNILSLVKIELLTLPADFLSIPTSAVEVLNDQGIIRVRATNVQLYSMFVPTFPKGQDNIAITYTYGYTTPPADVLKAVSLMGVSMFLGKEANITGGGTQLSVEGWSKSWLSRGKFESLRNDYALQAASLLRPYMTGVVSR